MFAGALDTIYSGGLKAGLQMEYVAVAEADERRRRCVGNSHLVPESQRYDSAALQTWGYAWRHGVPAPALRPARPCRTTCA